MAYERARDCDGSLLLKPVTTMYVKQIDVSDACCINATTPCQRLFRNRSMLCGLDGFDTFIYHFSSEKSLKWTLSID